MKKILIVVALAAIAHTGFAQAPKPNPLNNNQRALLNPFDRGPERAAASGSAYWGNISDDLDLNHVFQIANASLFPDSTVKQAYAGPVVGGKPTYQLGYTGLHAAGAVIDPKYDFSPVQVLPSNKYRLDSVALLYRYMRGRNTTDTLLVQVYNNSEINRYSLKDVEGNVIGRGGLLSVDAQTGMPAQTGKTIAYLLTDKDSSNSYKRLPIYIGLDVPANGIAAVVFTYLPGYNYNTGDTLEFNWDPKPHNRLNQFIAGMYVDLAKQKISSYNCGEELTKDERYSTSTGIRAMTPGNFYNDGYHYTDVDFHISVLNVGEKPVEANADGFTIYPNPLGANEALHIKWPVADAETEISICDMQMKTIATLTLPLKTGTNTIPAHLLPQSKGCYLLHIRSAGSTITKPFFIY